MPKIAGMADVLKWCDANGYRLQDARYKPQSLWLTGVSNKAVATMHYMCTCGWASERHACPHHGGKA